jgi:hypothetical protein
MQEIAPLDAYLSGPGRLRAAVTGMSREQMTSDSQGARRPGMTRGQLSYATGWRGVARKVLST